MFKKNVCKQFQAFKVNKKNDYQVKHTNQIKYLTSDNRNKFSKQLKK